MGEEIVLTVQGQVLLVLVQAGEGLHHTFKARMVVDIHGLQEKVLFAGIQNLLIRDNDQTHKTTVVVQMTVLLTNQPNVCGAGEPIIVVFVKNMIGGKAPHAPSVA